jgi:hypothetical protein
VLNTLTEHDFQDAFKNANARSDWNDAYARKGTISRMMVANRPEVSVFGKIAAPLPEIIDRLFGLAIRVPGYRTKMYCVSCKVLSLYMLCRTK